MTKIVRWCVVAITLSLLGVAAAEEGVNGNLVTVQWLNKNLKNPEILLLDVANGGEYAKAHIPGAVNVPMLVVNMPFGTIDVPEAQLEKLYQNTGISMTKKIVIYDHNGDESAARAFFSLYYHGLPAKNLFLLDGGLKKWKSDNLAVTQEPTPATPNPSFHFGKVVDSARADTAEVLAATGDTTNHVLIDALGPQWHFGQISPFNRSGHIPYSKVVDGKDFTNPDGTWKTADEIRKVFTFYGIRPDQTVYSFCGGGIAAAGPYFAAKFIAGYPNVKLYPESEMGWLADSRELPYWTYDAPYLMRDARWLQFWDSQMLRTFVGSQVSVVDVRSADAYSAGHVPYALNIPADVFRANVKDPAKLAETLGPAGVNQSHEAVILSGSNLTPDAALAFVALENLGQKKVSLLMEPVEKWAQPGFAITKNSTVVGEKKGPNDTSIVPTTYTASSQKNTIVTDPNSTRGSYPKVYIASGKDVPSNPPEGKVVHLAYTELLKADGTPKDAKDIWNILSKAGVPRYAEVVTFSDDPGEAAVNYYVLKLMGFPDVKMWAR